MEKVIYAKFSRERKKEYRIVTRIIENDNGKRVEKSALESDGNLHISKICSNMSLLEKYYLDDNIVITPCTMKQPDTVEFVYVDGVRYDEYFSDITCSGDVVKIQEELKRLKDILENVMEVQTFTTTEEFEKVFGENLGDILEGKKSYMISNIDMIFPNMILKDGKIYITDYEWVFEFPVPIDYILYRSLLLNHSFTLLKEDTKQLILSTINISTSDVHCYEKMEEAFQTYVSGKNVFDEYKKNSTKKILRLEDISPKFYPNHVQIIGISKNEKIVSQSNIQYKDVVHIKQRLTGDVNVLKMQFNIEGAVLKLQECYAIDVHGEKVRLEIKHNATLVVNDDYYFDNDCPTFEFENKKYDSFHIKVLVYYENSSIIGLYIKKIVECESVNQQLTIAKTKIDCLERSLAWKVYSKLKKMRKRN